MLLGTVTSEKFDEKGNSYCPDIGIVGLQLVLVVLVAVVLLVVVLLTVLIVVLSVSVVIVVAGLLTMPR